MKAYLMTQPGVNPQDGFPFDRIESEILVGFYARLGLIQALAAIEQAGHPGLEITDQKDAQGRALLSQVNQTTLERYAQELIIPYYEEKTGLDGDALAARAGLRSQTQLAQSDIVRVITNADDFILGDENLAWLRGAAGDRLTVFPQGGHLGNLYLEPVQQSIFGALEGRR